MPSERCEATIIIGDDYGDNDCTFRCQSYTGHTGQHYQSFRNWKACMSWDGDDSYERWRSAWLLFWDDLGACVANGLKTEEEFDEWLNP